MPVTNTPLSTVTTTEVTSLTQIRYNGFTFPPTSKYTVKQRVNRDRSGRARISNTYFLEVHAGIFSDTISDMSTQATDLRSRLSSPGQALKITNWGLGDIDMAGMTKTQKDMKWGPTPQVIDWNPIAGGIAFEIIWTCEFTIADCESAGQNENYKNFSAFSNTVTYSIDSRGLTTRAVAGYFEIPLTRGRSGVDISVAYTADDFRDQLLIPVPDNFRRVRNEFQLSDDRTQVNFQVVDTELETDDAYPPGIVEADLNYSLDNSKPMTFVEWDFVVDAAFERMESTPRDWSFQRFWLILSGVQERLRNNQNAIEGAGPGQNSRAWPVKIQIKSNKYRRTDSFMVGFKVIANAADVISATGMWQPVPGSDYRLWANSLADAWSVRGLANLQHDQSADAVIELCHGGTPAVGVKNNKVPYSYSSPPLFSCDDITPENSWLYFDNRITFEQDNNVAIHQPAQKWNPPADDDDNDFGNVGADIGPMDPAAKPAIAQHQGAPYSIIHMVGCSRRARYKPMVPRLKDFNGYEVVQFGQTIDGPKIDGKLADCYVYSLCWRIDYLVTAVPAKGTKIPDAPTPFQNDPDNQGD